MAKAHEIDYKIYGDDMQFVEIELDGGESVLAEAGAMMYMEQNIQMETIFDDGSGKNNGKGFMRKLMGAGKRLVTGEGLFMTIFTNNLDGKAHVAFAAPYPGKIIPTDLSEFGNTLICQKDAFLCAAKGVSIDIHLQKKIGAGFFGGEGLFLATLSGPGSVWLQSLPFSRMADRISHASGSKNKGETSGMNNPLGELAGIANLFGRD